MTIIFELFEYLMKQGQKCLIYLLNRNKSSVVNGEVKMSKSMLIMTRYPTSLMADI